MNNRYDYKPEKIFNLDKEVVLVTGAAGQLGSSIVNGLIDSNARVIAVDVSEDLLNKSAIMWEWAKEKVLLFECKMRIVFIGSVFFSKLMLEQLIRLNSNIVGICTTY